MKAEAIMLHGCHPLGETCETASEVKGVLGMEQSAEALEA